MPKPNEIIGRPVSKLTELTHSYAVDAVSELSREEVIEALSAQGIDSLDVLVDKSLEAARAGLHIGGGQVAKDTFLFTQFVYRTEGPGLPADLIEQVTSKIGRSR